MLWKALVSLLLIHSAVDASNLQMMRRFKESVSTWMQKRHSIPERPTEEEEKDKEEVTVEQAKFTYSRERTPRKFVERPAIPPSKPLAKAVERTPEEIFGIEVKKPWVSKRPAAKLKFP